MAQWHYRVNEINKLFAFSSTGNAIWIFLFVFLQLDQFCLQSPKWSKLEDNKTIHTGYWIAALLARLQAWQSNSIFRAVLLPPFDTGTIWSYSKFSLLPHFTHTPPSLRQTSRRTSEEIAIRIGAS